ncbi:hypothetical protein B4135_3144 [Caldibacillus debilis]|uniref:Uncharacterized protein n=1 Tax=Caldibacillus debilis TaxID=301148 RepID=A0A150LIQ1_9BACI|nr:hypothetical protein B4135_3144 [Caldibacillus debilis]
MPPVFLRKFLGLHPRGKILNRPRPERAAAGSAPCQRPGSGTRKISRKEFSEEKQKGAPAGSCVIGRPPSGPSRIDPV